MKKIFWLVWVFAASLVLSCCAVMLCFQLVSTAGASIGTAPSGSMTAALAALLPVSILIAMFQSFSTAMRKKISLPVFIPVMLVLTAGCCVLCFFSARKILLEQAIEQLVKVVNTAGTGSGIPYIQTITKTILLLPVDILLHWLAAFSVWRDALIFSGCLVFLLTVIFMVTYSCTNWKFFNFFLAIALFYGFLWLAAFLQEDTSLFQLRVLTNIEYFSNQLLMCAVSILCLIFLIVRTIIRVHRKRA